MRLALLFCIGCVTGAWHAPTVDNSVADGSELLAYDVTLHGVVLGTVDIEVSSIVGGKQLVRARGSGAGVVEMVSSIGGVLTSTIDVVTGYTLDEAEDVTVTALRQHKHQQWSDAWTIADAHVGMHSGVFMLRAWRSERGDERELEVWVEGHPHVIGVRDAGRDLVGSTPAVRYEMTLHGAVRIVAWVSADSARVPLRIEGRTDLGVFRVDLVHYES